MNGQLNVYIDGANLHKGSVELGFALDYKKFRGWLRQKFGVTKVYLFIGLVAKHTKLYEYLQECGYILIFKETTTNVHGQVKGNCDAEIVLKVVSDFYEKITDRFVLVTGDGDFRCLVDFLLEKKVETHVLAPNKQKCSILLKRTNASMLNLAEHFHKFSHSRKEKTPDKDVSL